MGGYWQRPDKHEARNYDQDCVVALNALAVAGKLKFVTLSGREGQCVAVTDASPVSELENTARLGMFFGGVLSGIFRGKGSGLETERDLEIVIPELTADEAARDLRGELGEAGKEVEKVKDESN